MIIKDLDKVLNLGILPHQLTKNGFLSKLCQLTFYPPFIGLFILLLHGKSDIIKILLPHCKIF